MTNSYIAGATSCNSPHDFKWSNIVVSTRPIRCSATSYLAETARNCLMALTISRIIASGLRIPLSLAN